MRAGFGNVNDSTMASFSQISPAWLFRTAKSVTTQHTIWPIRHCRKLANKRKSFCNPSLLSGLGSCWRRPKQISKRSNAYRTEGPVPKWLEDIYRAISWQKILLTFTGLKGRCNAYQTHVCPASLEFNRVPG